MDITKIPRNVLVSVRLRLGAEDDNDTSYDRTISKMGPTDMISKWLGWHLGSDNWGPEIIDNYEKLKKLDEETNAT